MDTKIYESVASGAAELPPLPSDPAGECHISVGEEIELQYGYSADQMRAYARAAIAALHKPVVAMTDEQIKAITTAAVRAGKVSWLGYEKDEDDKYTIPVLSPYHYQFAKAILAAAGPDAALVEALKFYAAGSHFHLHDPHAWDTVSGEPPNFYEDESNTATVEDGSVAKMALAAAGVQP